MPAYKIDEADIAGVGAGGALEARRRGSEGACNFDRGEVQGPSLTEGRSQAHPYPREVQAVPQRDHRMPQECHKERRLLAGSLTFSAVSTESQWVRRGARFVAMSVPCGSHESHR